MNDNTPNYQQTNHLCAAKHACWQAYYHALHKARATNYSNTYTAAHIAETTAPDERGKSLHGR